MVSMARAVATRWSSTAGARGQILRDLLQCDSRRLQVCVVYADLGQGEAQPCQIWCGLGGVCIGTPQQADAQNQVAKEFCAKIKLAMLCLLLCFNTAVLFPHKDVPYSSSDALQLMGRVWRQRARGELARVVCSQGIVFEVRRIDYLVCRCRGLYIDGKA